MIPEMTVMEDRRLSKVPQILASLVASIGGFTLGNVLAWTSPALPQIEESKEFGEISIEEKSWIGSLVTVGAIFSGPAAGFLIGRFGRRKTMIILSIPLFISWLLIAVANSVPLLSAGRFFTGFFSGAMTIVTPVYITEISEESIRGFNGSLFPGLCGLGVLFTYIVGAIVTSWRTLTLTCTVVPLIFLILLKFIPESPIYSLTKGEKREAGKALMWLRGAKDLEQVEIELLQMRSITDMSDIADMKGSKILTLRNFLSISVTKPLCISMALMLFQQLSGINAVIFYTVDIFKAAGTNIDPNLSTVIIGLVIVSSNVAATLLIDRLGRRILFIISNAGVAVCLFLLGVFFFVKERNDGIVPAGFNSLPLASLISFILLYNLGLGPIPWLMMGELIPPHVKGVGSAISSSFNWFISFLVTKSFEDIGHTFGTATCYWFFSIVGITGTVFTYLVLPETKGRTLEEIQNIFN